MASNFDHPKYMSLRPDQGGILDLFRILYSPNLSENRFFHCSAEVEIAEWRRRLALLFTLLLQMMFLNFRKPLAWLGDRVELLLNLVAHCHGFAPLLINFIKGQHIINIYIIFFFLKEKEKEKERKVKVIKMKYVIIYMSI